MRGAQPPFANDSVTRAPGRRVTSARHVVVTFDRGSASCALVNKSERSKATADDDAQSATTSGTIKVSGLLRHRWPASPISAGGDR